ncbi:cullin-3-B-like [Adelges cooleyi]|uniref:cullin-3-B-like n=1 Tax=Adelges cooleyi TaxID=133065 RepID=UPI00217F54DD|nr:cullin-3-B-like [Adelges cooleyi]
MAVPYLTEDDRLWETLMTTVQNVLKNNSIMSFKLHTDLYNYTYKLLSLKKGERLYNGLKETVSAHLKTNVLAKVLGSLNNHFLRKLEQCWQNHQRAMDVITYLFMHLNAVNRLHSVYSLGLRLFCDIVVHNDLIKFHLRETLLSMVMSERNGEVIDRKELERACRMLMVLGIQQRTVYEEDFEKPFLALSIKFYKFESKRLLAINSAPNYIKEAEACFRKEVELAENFMDPPKNCCKNDYNSTSKKIIQAFKEHLIQKNIKAILEMENSGLVFMLRNKRTNDLACMYNFLKKFPDELETMLDCLSKYLREEGCSLVKEDETNLNPITCIQSLLDLKDRFDLFLNKCFVNDKMFKQTISSGFIYFLNLNPKSPEYLSLFIDDKLKRGVCGMDEDDLESVLDKAIALFRLLQDKDVFETYYRRLLAKRLLHNKSVSDDIEKNMISKLILVCGRQFTYKLEGMLKDMALSNFMMDSFKNLARTPLNCKNMELSVCVLTTGYWPLPATTPKCNMPSVAQLAYNNYQNFCIREPKGHQQLRLQPQLGWADITAVFNKTRQDNSATSTNAIVVSRSLNSGTSVNSIGTLSTRKYNFQVSTYQMAILMLFNTYEKITMETIMNKTEIDKEDLTHVLQSLVMGKPPQRVLLKSPNTPEIELSHEFSVNESYMSNKFQVQIMSTSTKSESKPEFQKTKDTVEEDRMHKIEAAVVCIMKARKKLTHDTLVIEVVEQLRSQFMPSYKYIKERIEWLIEKEYIARTLEDQNTYIYVI